MSRLCCLVITTIGLCACGHLVIVRAAEPSSGERNTLESAQELFDLFGLDKQSFEHLLAGEPSRNHEQELIAKLLVRLPQIKLIDIERWTNRSVEWRDVAVQPANYQRMFLRLHGKAVRVTRIVPAAEIQNRFAIDAYYRCELALDDSDDRAIVYARSVPQKWPLDSAIDERASANAVFLMAASKKQNDTVEFHLAADRIAWHPPTSLGNAGMDCGLFDTIEQQKPITHGERECFYQLLAAAKRAAGDEVAVTAGDPVSQLGRLMSEPAAHVGEPYSFRGVARRAIKIQVADADTVKRLGFDHYFEVEVFLDLEGLANVAGRKVRTYPVVFCLRDLPDDMPTGEHIAESVQATGFMFKKWPYVTPMTEAAERPLKVASPLLIGDTLNWLPSATASGGITEIAACIFISLIALFGLVAWWFHRRDRITFTAIRGKRSSLPAGESLDDLEIDSGINHDHL